MHMIFSNSINNVIGYKDGSLVFKCKEDFEEFRLRTMYNTLIMGRKTFESLPKKLENRKILVLTSKADELVSNDYVTYCKDVQSVLNVYHANKKHRGFVVCGGAEIYKLFLLYVDTIYETEYQIYVNEKDSVQFNFERHKWNVVNEYHSHDDKTNIGVNFIKYVRNENADDNGNQR